MSMLTKLKENAGSAVNGLIEKAGFINIKAVDSYMRLINAGGGLSGTDVFGDQFTTSAYGKLITQYRSWVYTCVDKIAKTIASLPLNLYVYSANGKVINGTQIKNYIRHNIKDGEGHLYLKAQKINKTLIDEHPLYDLFKKPNQLSTRFTLWYDTVIRLELAGKCGWYIPKNKLGLPGAITVLPVTKTADLTPIPDPVEMIKGYSYVDGQLKQHFEVDEIIFMRYPNPESPFEGMSPLMAQSYPYDIENYMMQQQRELYKNKATPGNVFTTDRVMNGTLVDSLKAHVTSEFKGASKAGKLMVLHSGLKQDKPIGMNAKDLMLEEVAKFTKDKIITGFDMSPGKLGLVEDVNRANMEALDKSYYSECITPKTMLIEEYIESDLLPYYDENITADFDVPNVIDQEQRRKEMETNLKTGKTVINEERAKDGQEPVSWGDKPWLPFNLTQPGEAEPIKAFKTETETKDATSIIEWKQFANFQEEQEIPLHKAMKNYFIDLHMRTMNKFNDDNIKDVNIDIEQEAKLLKEIAAPIQFITMMNAGQRRLDLLSTIKQQTEFTFMIAADSEASKWLGSRLKLYSEEVAGTTFDKINKVLQEGFDDALPIGTISENLDKMFDSAEQYRSMSIARTETVAAVNFSDLDAVKQSGLDDKLSKYWIASQDSAVRDTHNAAEIAYTDGIDIEEEFSVGADVMASPGNGSIAKENINCRCTLGYKKKG